MKKSKVEPSKEFFDNIKVLCEKAKKAEFLTTEMIVIIEDFLYGNMVKNILKNLLDENNKKALYEEFNIGEEEITKVRLYPTLLEFSKDENPKGTIDDYIKFKAMLSTAISPKINDFITYFEETILLKDCAKELTELKKLCTTEETLVEKIEDSLKVGFTDTAGNFSDLNSSKFRYFNKYSDEQLDEIYKASPYNREVIDKVREYRKKLKEG